jgi:hypothetical protein
MTHNLERTMSDDTLTEEFFAAYRRGEHLEPEKHFDGDSAGCDSRLSQASAGSKYGGKGVLPRGRAVDHGWRWQLDFLLHQYLRDFGSRCRLCPPRAQRLGYGSGQAAGTSYKPRTALILC